MTKPNTSTGLTGSSNTHARLAPSSSKRWTTCTGSVAFIEANAHRIPGDTSSRDADFGTIAHEWAAKVLLKQITIDQVPDEFRESIVEPYVNHCMEQVDGAALTSIETCLEDASLGIDPPDHVFFVEEQLALFYQPDQTGTADFLGVVAEAGAVKKFVGRDLKAGAGVLVTNEDNSQLAIYIYSAIKLLDGIYSFGPETPVDLAVFQPRHREASEIKPWILTLSDLAMFCKDIEYAAIQAHTGLQRVREKILSEMLVPDLDIAISEILEAAPGLKFAPGEGDGGACRWCKAKGFCEARLNSTAEDLDHPDKPFAELISDMPDLSKADNKLPADERIEARTPVIAQPLDDAYLVKVFAARKNIGKWLDDVAEYLESRVMAGEKVPGLKLVMGREGNRDWTDAEAADKLLAQSGKLKMEERYKMSLISPTQAEEKLAEKIEKSTRFRNCFTALVGRSPAKPVLALESDKREAVSSPVDDMPVVDDDLGEL